MDVFNDGEKGVIQREYTYLDDERNFVPGDLATLPGSPVGPNAQSFNFTDRNLNSTHH